jgi:hypothetical protein
VAYSNKGEDQDETPEPNSPNKKAIPGPPRRKTSATRVDTTRGDIQFLLAVGHGVFLKLKHSRVFESRQRVPRVDTKEFLEESP